MKSVLIEIGQILGSFKGKFAVIGGAVPWLLLEADDMHHVGTIDVDLGLDAEALGDGEYATLVESLQEHGSAVTARCDSREHKPPVARTVRLHSPAWKCLAGYRSRPLPGPAP